MQSFGSHSGRQWHPGGIGKTCAATMIIAQLDCVDSKPQRIQAFIFGQRVNKSDWNRSTTRCVDLPQARLLQAYLSHNLAASSGLQGWRRTWAAWRDGAT